MMGFKLKIGDSFMIGNNIKVTVLKIVEKQVRFGIEAPRSVSVHREEIYNRLKRLKKKNKLLEAGMEMAEGLHKADIISEGDLREFCDITEEDK